MTLTRPLELYYPPPTTLRWTSEPQAIAAVVAFLRAKLNRVVEALPVAAVVFASVDEPDPTIFSLHVDASDLFTVYRPLAVKALP